MKQRIDLQKAADGEAFGALAVGADRKHRSIGGAVGQRFTPAQNRALSALARSLVKVAREAGAEQRRIIVGDVSFELQENGSEEILSIRTATGS
ncbi:MAG: hypothetical protein ABSH38_12235 [Verrucomicrobiota bacterium]|jgi:hypothetical protein